MTITLGDAGAREGVLVVHHRGALALARAEGCDVDVAEAGRGVWRISVGNRRRGGARIRLEEVAVVAGEGSSP